MSLDLDNNEHVRCLRETIALWSDLTPEQRETWLEKLRRDCALSEQGPREVLAAAEALTEPAKAAELISRLVERAGVTCAATSVSSLWEHRGHDVRVGSTERGRVHIANAPAGDWQAMDLADVPPLILRLLSLAPNAGADAVLAALRGEA